MLNILLLPRCLHNKRSHNGWGLKIILCCFSFTINPSYFKLIERKLSFFPASFFSQDGKNGKPEVLKSYLRKSNVKCYIVLEIGKSQSHLASFLRFELAFPSTQIESDRKTNDKEIDPWVVFFSCLLFWGRKLVSKIISE